MICPRCQTEMNDDANFCPHCGLKIEKCEHCHQPLLPGAFFCTHCGETVSKQAHDETSNNVQESTPGVYTPLEVVEKQKDLSTQQEDIPGQYVPINAIGKEVDVERKTLINDEEVVEEETIDFNAIPTNKKVNKPLLIGSIVFLIVASVVSYMYLFSGEGYSPSQTAQTTINGTNSYTSIIGNNNLGGHVYTYNDMYYIVNKEGHLIRMDKTMSNQTDIINDNVEYVNIVNDYIYYTNKDHLIYRADLDGTNQTEILNQKAYYMFVIDNLIYYQNDTQGEKIYVYDLTSHSNTKLNDMHSYNLNVIEDKIYYTSTDGVYVMNIDGTGQEKLVEGSVNSLVFYNNILYYNQSTQIKMYNIETKKIDFFLTQNAMIANMTDEYLFYYTSEGLQRYSFEDKRSQLIYNQISDECEILGDHLVLIKDDTYIIMDFDGKNILTLSTDEDIV